jgi:hypothetical protein
MASCWFCHEVIEEAPPIPAPAPSSSSATPAPTPLRPSGSAAVYVPLRAARGHAVRRVIVGGVAAGLLVTASLLALEAASTRFATLPPASISLERRSFEEVGISIATPKDWTQSLAKRRVTLLSSEAVAGRSTRGLRVLLLDVPFKEVEDEIDRLAAGGLAGYDRLAPRKEKVAGKRGIVQAFIGEDERLDQWWIDRGKKQMVRFDMWSRTTDDDASELNALMVRSVKWL